MALVIGNAAYTRAEPLANPANDAQDMARMLEALGFAVSTGIDLGRDQMENTLLNFQVAIQDAEVALLFYAGHGVQVKGENYLLPIDADIEIELHLKRRTFSLSEIIDFMGKQTSTNLIFLDACRNDPFTHTALRTHSPNVERARTLALDGRHALSRGLAEVRAARGTFIAFATAPNEVALDGKGRNSPFTEGLLKHIPTPGQSVTDMMTAVIDEVARVTENKQAPWQQSNLREKFYFESAPAQSRSTPIEPQINPVNPEHEYWLDVRERHDPRAFERFLRSFPNGDFASLAANRALERIDTCENIQHLERLLVEFPATPRKAQVEARLASLLWLRLQRSRDGMALEAFEVRFPRSAEAAKARERLRVLQYEKPNSLPKVLPLVGVIILSIAGFLFYLNVNGKLPPDTPTVRILAERKDVPLTTAEIEGELVALSFSKATPSVPFKECKYCPSMRAIPDGNFLMGSPESEVSHMKDESGPNHEPLPVAILRPFAIGMYEVTVGEYKSFVSNTNYSVKGNCEIWSGSSWVKKEDATFSNPGFAQQDNQPVVCVSWDDAKAPSGSYRSSKRAFGLTV
jgi:formylglycine-generating enzyme required for sulfatase activity